MLHHTVLMRFREGTPDEAIQAVVDELRALPPHIPEIRTYAVGRDAALVAGNWDVAVVATFDDGDGFFAYRQHPLHLKVLNERIEPFSETRVAVQFDASA